MNFTASNISATKAQPNFLNNNKPVLGIVISNSSYSYNPLAGFLTTKRKTTNNKLSFSQLIKLEQNQNNVQPFVDARGKVRIEKICNKINYDAGINAVLDKNGFKGKFSGIYNHASNIKKCAPKGLHRYGNSPCGSTPSYIGCYTLEGVNQDRCAGVALISGATNKIKHKKDLECLPVGAEILTRHNHGFAMCTVDLNKKLKCKKKQHRHNHQSIGNWAR